ncbi:MAG: hypothetical protein LDL41_03630 [Coleofasciculus sp. S288]|nr:hypothetical protein [Coleofasciculus sp. S288]
MAKRVILTLMEGSFEHGFPVILNVKKDDALAEEMQIIGKLPSEPNILRLFEDWQSTYYHLVMSHSPRIKSKPNKVTNFSQLADSLRKLANECDHPTVFRQRRSTGTSLQLIF